MIPLALLILIGGWWRSRGKGKEREKKDEAGDTTQRHCTSLRYHALFACASSQWPMVSLRGVKKESRARTRADSKAEPCYVH